MKVDGIARQGLGRLLRIALTGSVCLAQVLSKASEPATIVLVANHADATIIPLLHAELSNLGLNVLVVDRGDHELSPSELTEAARRNHAFAAFRILVAQGRVEVWLADRVTGKVLLREVLRTQSPQSETSESTVVARAVELLRASLLELDVGERPEGEVAPPASLPSALAPPTPHATLSSELAPSRFAINTSFVFLGASLRAGLSPGLGVAPRWQLTPNFAIVGRFAAPIAGPEYSTEAGHAQLTPRLATASLRWSSNSFSGRFRGAIESGVGMLWTRTVTGAAPGYSADIVVANDVDPVPFVGGELSYKANRDIALAIGLLGGPGLRPTKYMFDDQVIGRYGRWVGLASLGLDVVWN